MKISYYLIIYAVRKMAAKQALIVSSGMKMADAIIGSHHLILMLEHFSINLAVQEKTVAQICSDSGLNPKLFLAFANLLSNEQINPAIEFTYDDILVIIDYLKKSHNYYLEEKYPKIRQYIKLLIEQNGQPGAAMLDKFFDDYVKEVTSHLVYEDEVVFPYMANLLAQIKQKRRNDDNSNYSVTEYQDHHDDIEEKLNDIKNLLIKYLPVGNDSQVRRKLLLSLFDLDQDLIVHTKIEESILIPLAERMEKEIKLL